MSFLLPGRRWRVKRVSGRVCNFQHVDTYISLRIHGGVNMTYMHHPKPILAIFAPPWIVWVCDSRQRISHLPRHVRLSHFEVLGRFLAPHLPLRVSARPPLDPHPTALTGSGRHSQGRYIPQPRQARGRGQRECDETTKQPINHFWKLRQSQEQQDTSREQDMPSPLWTNKWQMKFTPDNHTPLKYHAPLRM